MKYTLSILVSFLTATQAFADPISDAQKVIPAFRVVSRDIYRGGLPSEEGMEALERLQVRTILDLHTDKSEIRRERGWAEDRRMTFVSIPLATVLPIKERTVRRAVAVMGDRSLYPIYVHCRHGEDRTGLIVALHRVLNEGVAAPAAYDEMLRLGFHRTLIFLHHMFEDVTGYDP